jgi:2,5-diketo-D-gluconate reductase B
MEHLTISGVSVPKVGLGTWALRGETCRDVVRLALDLGYRHIDTAEMYGNEQAIGEALALSSVARDDIFLTSKVWQNHMTYADVLATCDQSLADLGTDYVDLYLIHWPVSHVPIDETVSALDELQRTGRTRHIGVSNFSVAQQRSAQSASQFGILTNQVEFNPWRQPRQVLSACQESDVLVTAYTPLARGRVLSSDTLAAIGSRYDKTAAQVTLRWLIQKPNVITIPKAANPDHLRENLEVFDFELDGDAVMQIDGLVS